MNIGQILKQLDTLIDANNNLTIEGVSREFCSYRGYYQHLAMAESVGRQMAAVAFYNVLSNQLGKTFQGYKGGDYVMEEDCLLFVAEYGKTGQQVGGVAVNDEGITYLVQLDEDFNGL